jgi:OPT family oligopeptide transporter
MPIGPQSFLLASLESSSHTSVSRKDSDEELDPESTSALLRRHLSESTSGDDEDDGATTKLPSSRNIIYKGLFPRLVGLMSIAPLLLRSAPGFGTGSYGAAPIGASTEYSDEEDSDDAKQKDRRRTKASGLINAVSASSGRASKKSGRSNSELSSQSFRRRSSNTRRYTSRSARSDDEDEDDIADNIGLEGRVGVSGVPIQNTTGLDASSNKDNLTRANPEEAIVEDDSTTEDEEVSLDESDPPDNSPYAQVRASVSAIDNTSLAINTPRMWTLSMLFAILGSSTNLFFSLRYPSVSITPVIALLLVHPLGLLWDGFLKHRDDPEEEFIDGVLSRRTTNIINANHQMDQTDSIDKSRPLQRLRLWLSQGRWNEKEHSCVYISSNVSFGFAFATDVIVEQTQFYKQDVGVIYQLLLILSTQILGYTFAGLARRFLVRPGGMIWPGTLMSAAMFTTLHKEEGTIANGWRITRWKFFFVVWLSAFLFYFLPGLLMPALSYFSVITWFAPKNVVIANLFGVSSGLGLFPVTFDWAQIAYVNPILQFPDCARRLTTLQIGSPLLTPFWAAMNVVGGLVIVMWIIAPISYYKNLFYSSYMPILSSTVFDNTGNIYDVSKILTPDFLFDKEAYHNYSRVFLPITYVLSYGLQFAALASLLTHTACWHGKDIWRQWRRSLKEVEGETKGAYKAVPRPVDNTASGRNSSAGNGRRRLEMSDSNMDNIISQEDVHNRLMKRYKDAPLSWYLVTFVSMTAIGIFVVE